MQIVQNSSGLDLVAKMVVVVVVHTVAKVRIERVLHFTLGAGDTAIDSSAYLWAALPLK